MTNLEAAATEFLGRNVAISTIEGPVNGTLYDVVKDEQGNVSHIVVRQYFHRTKVEAKNILMIRQV